jgi:hypothetical protein
LDGVAHQLDHQNSLAHARSTKEADLAAAWVGGQQVDGLDAGDERLGDHALPAQRGRRGVDRAALHPVGHGLAVDGLTQYVEQAAQRRSTHRYADRMPGIGHRQPAAQSCRTAHGDGTHGARIDVLLHLDDQFGAVVALDDQRVVDAG